MKWSRRSGMSLLELLLALALVASISVALATTTSFGARLFDRTASLADGNTAFALRRQLRFWLERALPPDRLVPLPSEFLGQTDKFKFLTLANAPFAQGSFGLGVEIRVEGDTLVMQVDEIGDDGELLRSHLRTLTREAANIRFAYFSSDPENLGWQDVWDDPARLPALVRIEIDPLSNPEWPEFNVRLVQAAQFY